MRSRRFASVMVIALVFSAALAWGQKDVPYGWHEPTQEELKLKVQADFDGDGKSDTAQILADVNKRAVGVFVYPSSTQRWVKLDSDRVAEMPKWHVKVLDGGSYTGVCEKDEKNCTPGALKLERPSVDLAVDGTAESIFYWDTISQSFKHTRLAKTHE